MVTTNLRSALPHCVGNPPDVEKIVLEYFTGNRKKRKVAVAEEENSASKKRKVATKPQNHPSSSENPNPSSRYVLPPFNESPPL